MTSLVLCSLPGGAFAPLGKEHKINDVIMTSRSYHVTNFSSRFIRDSCSEGCYVGRDERITITERVTKQIIDNNSEDMLEQRTDEECD